MYIENMYHYCSLFSQICSGKFLFKNGKMLNIMKYANAKCVFWKVFLLAFIFINDMVALQTFTRLFKGVMGGKV